MLDKHDCEACDKSKECEMKEAIEACRDSYKIGLPALANMVAGAVTAEVETSTKVMWVNAAISVIDVHNIDEVRKMLALVDTAVGDSEAYEELKETCVFMAIDHIMTRAARMCSTLADAFGIDMRFSMGDGQEVSHNPTSRHVH